MCRLKPILIISTLLVLAGCANGTAVLSEATSPGKPSEQPGSSALVTPVKTSTITFLPSISPVSLTLEPIDTPTPTRKPGIKNNCLSIQPSLPGRHQYSGKLVFENHLPGAENSLSIYDLQTGEATANIPGGIDASISPDGARIAYYNPVAKTLEILDSEGEQLRSLPWKDGWGQIDHWLGNNDLLIVRYEQETPSSIYLKYPPTVSLVNPFTGEAKNLAPDYPDIDKEVMITSWPWSPSSITIYHPNLDRVIYPSPFDDGGIVLYDILGQQKLATIRAYDWRRHPPAWSPDGSKFIFMGDDGFYLVTYDGKVSKLTTMNSVHRSETDKLNYKAEYYSWSPNNRSVATWIYSPGSEQRTLVLLDTLTGEITDYCISAGYDPRDVRTPPSPIWSPDGKSLVAATNYQSGEYTNDILLLDLEKNIGYKISENNFPVGWLVSP